MPPSVQDSTKPASSPPTRRLRNCGLLVVGGAPAIAELGPALAQAGLDHEAITEATDLEQRTAVWQILLVLPPFADGEMGIRLLATSANRAPDAWRLLATGDTSPTHLLRAVNRGRVQALLPWPSSVGGIVDAVLQSLEQRGAWVARQHAALRARLEASEAAADRHRQQMVELERRSLMPHLMRGLAHELNNPLGVVLGQTERLLRGSPANSDTHRRASIVLGETRRCIALVSRLRGLAQAPLESLVLCQLDKSFKLAQDLLRERRLPAVTVRFRGPIEVVQGAPRGLARAIEQVLDNARLAGADTVTVTCERLGQRLFVHIDNAGETPDDDELRHALQPFYSSRGAAGHQGLGLTLASGLLRDMGGQLLLARGPTGSGCRCTLELPLPPDRTTEVLGRDQRAPGVPPHRPPVLLLDDEPMIAELLGDLLGETTYAVLHAATLAEAEAALAAGPVSAVIADLHLPDGDGLGFLRHVVTAYPALRQRIALVTGDATDPLVCAGAAELGAPIIAKPFRIATMQKALAEILGG